MLGLIFQNKYLLFGISGGCAISVIALYMLSQDSKAIAYSKDVKVAKRIAYIGYAKRYFLHLLFLGILLYFYQWLSTFFKWVYRNIECKTFNLFYKYS